MSLDMSGFILEGVPQNLFPWKYSRASRRKEYVLALKKGMELLLKDALKERNYEEEAFTLARATRYIRSDVINTPIFRFNGEFSLDCQSKSVPLSLKYLFSMLLNGANIESQDSEESRACLTIAR